MMLLERWVIATVVGLALPLVSTVAWSSAPQQASPAQTGQPAKPEQDRAKPANNQDPQAANDNDDQDENPGTSAYDRDTPAEDRDPAIAGDDQNTKPAISASDRDTQPGTGSEDQSPSKVDDDKDAKPAKVAQEQPAQPNKSSDVQNPVKASERALALPPATPEQAEQLQLEKDSATLLQLVQELKAEVEKAGSNTLSLAALRKADEIQRLAKNLKEKMKEQGQVSQNKP
jgi:hypothetical protein